MERARTLADNPRLHHVVVAAGEEALPYTDLGIGPLTDEPGPSLTTAGRHRRRLLAGSADHFVGHGARQVLDAHPARLADLLMDRRRRHLLRPVTALAKADGPSAQSVLVPFTVYRAARRLARTPYSAGIADTARRLLERQFADEPVAGGAVDASLAALAWCRPGPAARWLTGEALAEVSVRLSDAANRSPAVGRPGERRARAALARQAADHRVFEQAAEVRNQRLHAPFLDNQVVLACRALPDTLRVQPGARAAVLRSVLAGAGVRDLPPGWGATSHVTHAAAVRAGLRGAVGDLVQLFDTPLLADAGLVEARVVRKALRSAAEGRRCRWTAWPSWSPRSCGCGGWWRGGGRVGRGRGRRARRRSRGEWFRGRGWRESGGVVVAGWTGGGGSRRGRGRGGFCRPALGAPILAGGAPAREGRGCPAWSGRWWWGTAGVVSSGRRWGPGLRPA